MKLYLTGASGYLGSRLARTLLEQGHEVLATPHKSPLPAGVTSTSDKNPLDVQGIIHMATSYQGAWDVNIDLPKSLIQKNHHAFFFHMDTLLGPNVSEYARTKAELREHLQKLEHQAPLMNLRSDLFFGPNLGEKNFVTRMLAQLQSGVPSIALSPGHQHRYLIYVDDVIQAIMTLIGHVQNLSPGFHGYEVGLMPSVSIRELMALLQQLTNNTHTILDYGKLPYREGEDLNPSLDLEPLSKLGWRAQWTLEQGLKQCL